MAIWHVPWIWLTKIWLSCRTTKQNDMCTQRRLRSAWASAQSDQSSLCAQLIVRCPMFFHADSKNSDQTGRMPRLIWVFAGRTGFVDFVMLRLKFHLVFYSVWLQYRKSKVSSKSLHWKCQYLYKISSYAGTGEIDSKCFIHYKINLFKFMAFM